MIKRISILVLMALLAAAGFFVQRPADPPEPLAGLIIDRPRLGFADRCWHLVLRLGPGQRLS